MSQDHSRRSFLKQAGLGAAALGMAARAGAAPASGAPPNIVLIMVDDMGYSDLGCYGGEIDTPNLDRLAREGMRFSQFYNNAKCSPTRASLLTGLYSQQVGVSDGPVPLHNCVTIAEALRGAGYRTYMSGKWHLGETPVERGFERYYGLLDGCCNFFNPGGQRPGEPKPAWKSPRKWYVDGEVRQPFTPEDPDFYTTDAFTDNALKYLDEAARGDAPFLLYLAYTAPHYPMQAPEADIAKYRGKYRIGWDELRKRRHERQKEMGLLDPRWALSPQDPALAAWDDIGNRAAWDFDTINEWYTHGLDFDDASNADLWDLKMAVYAAMVDRMDRNVGRVMDKLKAMGAEENTLVLFLSDNGGCAQVRNDTPDVPPGPVNSYRTVDPPWANAQNTPFRRYKRWNYEGGISTPLIARWPARIEAGGITHQWGHVVDIMATCLDIAGQPYPTEHEGHPVQPLVGKSLLPVFDGNTREPHGTFCWQFGKHQAVRQGDWKLVSAGKAPWELYNLAEDRTELNNRAGEMPERAAAMQQAWNDWAGRVGAHKRG